MPSGLAKAAWGQAGQGMSPTEVSKLRSAMAGATGINQPGRCRTMAILLAYGLRQDHAVKLACDTVTLWIDLWREHPEVRADARHYWRNLHQELVVDGKVIWHLVTGPLSATIATMTSLGWSVQFAELWADPAGAQWALRRNQARGGPAHRGDHREKTLATCCCRMARRGATSRP